MIEIFNETNEIIDEKKLYNLIKMAKRIEKVENVSFNVIIVGNKEIQAINKEYRQTDKPTDVISFALEDTKEDEQFIKKFGRILGDIYISIDKVKEQAKEYGHSEERELSFLLVHGFLHLLGYNHMIKKDEVVMFERQDMILNEAKITR